MCETVDPGCTNAGTDDRMFLQSRGAHHERARRGRPRCRSSARPAPPRLETLEDRFLLAGNPTTLGVGSIAPPDVPIVIRAGADQGGAVEATVDEIALKIGGTPDPPPPSTLPETGTPHATLASAQVLPTVPDLTVTGRLDPAGAPAFFRVPLDPSDSEVSVGLSWSNPAATGAEDLTLLDGSGLTLLNAVLSDQPGTVSVKLRSVSADPAAAIFVEILPLAGRPVLTFPGPEPFPGGGPIGYLLRVTKPVMGAPSSTTVVTDLGSGKPSPPPTGGTSLFGPLPSGHDLSPGPVPPMATPGALPPPISPRLPTLPGIPVGGIFQPRVDPLPASPGGEPIASTPVLASGRQSGGNLSPGPTDRESGSTVGVPGPVRPAVRGVSAPSIGRTLFAAPAGSWIDRAWPGVGGSPVPLSGVASRPPVAYATGRPPRLFAPGPLAGIDGPDRRPAELPDLGPLTAAGSPFPADAVQAVGVLGVLSGPVGHPEPVAALAADTPGRWQEGDEEPSGPRRRPRRGVLAFVVYGSAALILGVSAPSLTSVLRTRAGRENGFVSVT